MNQCQSYCRLIKRMGMISTPKVSVWQSIVNTCIGNQGKTYTDSVTTFGSVGTTAHKWIGGALASNGKIYCRPNTASSILVIDTADDTTTTISGISGSSNWSNFVTAKDGYIYGAPYGASTFIKVDPRTDTFTTFSSTVGTGWDKFCASESGLLYGFKTSTSSTSVLVFDPASNTQSTITSQINTNQLEGHRYHPNGRIYMFPSSGKRYYYFDTTDETSSSFGSYSSSTSYNYLHSVVSYDESVYGLPGDAKKIAKINPSDNSVSTFGSFSNPIKWIGSVMAPNGCIYCIPSKNASILKIDTTNDTTSTFGSLGTYDFKWQGAILAPNGCIYGIPRSASTILKIDPGSSVNTNFSLEALLSPYIN